MSGSGSVVIVFAVIIMSCIVLGIAAVIVYYSMYSSSSASSPPQFSTTDYTISGGSNPPPVTGGPGTGPGTNPETNPGTNPGTSPGSGRKPMVFLNLSGHGDAANGRMQDAVDMAQGKGWEYVAANIDGWNINPANTHDPWKIIGATKKRPTWILHENEVSASLINAGNTYIDAYQKWIDQALPGNNRVYGRFIMRDRDPSGRRYEPGVMTKWKNAAPFAGITKTVFASGRGTEFTESCSEALCEQNWSALREGDGFVYEQVPGFLNANHGSRAGEWPGHRGAWKKLFDLSKQHGGKKILWLMATDGAGSLQRAQESFNWMKSSNLVPDVIVVANYGADPASPDPSINTLRNAYRSIPEGKGNQYPDTVCGIARWLLDHR